VQNQNKPNAAGAQQQNRGNNKQTKFDSEFDFEQANSKFEEFRSQFAKLKVGAEEPKVPEQVNWLCLSFLAPIWRFVLCCGV
jgi:protein LSM14